MTSSPCPRGQRWCWQGLIKDTNYRDTALLLQTVFIL